MGELAMRKENGQMCVIPNCGVDKMQNLTIYRIYRISRPPKYQILTSHTGPQNEHIQYFTRVSVY